MVDYERSEKRASVSRSRLPLHMDVYPKMGQFKQLIHTMCVSYRDSYVNGCLLSVNVSDVKRALLS